MPLAPVPARLHGKAAYPFTKLQARHPTYPRELRPYPLHIPTPQHLSTLSKHSIPTNPLGPLHPTPSARNPYAAIALLENVLLLYHTLFPPPRQSLSALLYQYRYAPANPSIKQNIHSILSRHAASDAACGKDESGWAYLISIGYLTGTK